MIHGNMHLTARSRNGFAATRESGGLQQGDSSPREARTPIDPK